MNSSLVGVFEIVVLIFSAVIHEVSHGYAALALGDQTAKNAGRLTLNPLKHLDPVGSVLVPLGLYLFHSPFIFGWANPVPYNPYNLYKDYKYGPLKVALAGPLANFCLAVIFALVIRVGISFLSPITVVFLDFVVFINCLLMIFNLVPIPPLDGSKVLTVILPSRYSTAIERSGTGGLIFVLLLLFLFSSVIFSASFYLFQLLTGPAAAGLMGSL
ncbi:MAG TPA: site-2 protease family protein [Candidatus Tyrphobacter sp.]|nr:site-2 protease family protein [Candidatus Tyrphobacter sp.]